MLPNVLNMAMNLTGSQEFIYTKYANRTANSAGWYVNSYQQGITVSGQVQAVPREFFQKYGLDFQKRYLIFYISQHIIDVDRDVAGDQINFAGKTYTCISETDWFPINGWTAVLAAQTQV